MRVLVSTAFPNAVVKINSSCTEGNDSDCANLRGKTFAPNASSTYINKGIFNLYAELNFTTQYDRAYYGFDTLGFGLDSSGFSIDKQIIASTNTDDYFLGLLGIDPQPTNFTNFDDPTPSLFTTLMNQKLIPSLSYSYTAGAQYRKQLQCSIEVLALISNRIQEGCRQSGLWRIRLFALRAKRSGLYNGRRCLARSRCRITVHHLHFLYRKDNDFTPRWHPCASGFNPPIYRASYRSMPALGECIRPRIRQRHRTLPG